MKIPMNEPITMFKKQFNFLSMAVHPFPNSELSSAIPPSAGKRGMNMNFNHEELMLMMLYNTGTRLGLIHELRLMQCYLMPDETALRELSEGVIEKLKLLTDAEFAELEFPLD